MNIHAGPVTQRDGSVVWPACWCMQQCFFFTSEDGEPGYIDTHPYAHKDGYLLYTATADDDGRPPV